MPATNVKSQWVGGDLYFYDKSGNEICHFDGTSRIFIIPSGSGLHVAGVTVDQTTLAMTGLTATAAELNKAHGLGANAYLPVVEVVTFTETTGAGVYTGSVPVPADATILDIQIRSPVLWTATTSALMDVGDVATPTGWYVQINLKATDLLLGEVIKFDKSGGKEGAYLVQASGLENTSYSASQRVISGVITTVGAAGSAGRTRMLVMYVLPTATAAVKV